MTRTIVLPRSACFASKKKIGDLLGLYLYRDYRSVRRRSARGRRWSKSAGNGDNTLLLAAGQLAGDKVEEFSETDSDEFTLGKPRISSQRWPVPAE